MFNVEIRLNKVEISVFKVGEDSFVFMRTDWFSSIFCFFSLSELSNSVSRDLFLGQVVGNIGF